MWTYKTKPMGCPYCGIEHNACTNPEEDIMPSPGDASVCINCAKVSIFNDKLELRELTHEETIEIYTNVEVQRIISSIQYSNRRKN